MRVLETTIYTFDELSEQAKERARDWWRSNFEDNYWAECVLEDFERICALIGVELKTLPVKLMGGGTRQKPCVWWSGFWSQGDGACFEGRYSYRKGALREIKEHAPRDEKLHQIALDLQIAQEPNFYQLWADCWRSGHYYHEYCMHVRVERDSEQALVAGSEEAITEALRDLAHWFYRALEKEYEYLNSDE